MKNEYSAGSSEGGGIPSVRGDCLRGGWNACRPCRFTRCRYHLLPGTDYEVEEGGRYVPCDKVEDKLVTLDTSEDYEAEGPHSPERRSYSVLRANWRMRPSCALDVADKGPLGLLETGQIMGVSKERVRQLECRALDRAEILFRLLGVDESNTSAPDGMEII